VKRFSTLISPEELQQHLAAPELRIVDCRASLQDRDAGRQAYRAAHLPGALFADLEQDLSGPIVPGVTGRHPLPSIPTFIERLRAWGIGNASQVVAYDDASGAFAARLWWLLRWLGHDAVAVLDGGFSAWSNAGYALTSEPPSFAAQDFTPTPHAEWLVTADEVAQSSGRAPLFDARARERFRGDEEPIDPVAGHIPGARSLPFAENLRSGRFRPAGELRTTFEAALAGHAAQDAIMYCGSGVTACHNVLAFAHAGLPLPRLYAGSWSEWITVPARSVARG
jgi:thiosulfate/3-mercaptopyruvate sulfurtransferase